MSLPENTLSTKTVSGPFKGARNRSEINQLLDWEDGGIAINDISEGLEYQAWRCRIVGQNIVINPEFGSDITLYTSSGSLTECSLTFDQAMNPIVTFVEDGVAKLRWYDNNLTSWQLDTLPVGATSPRVSLDDKRMLSIDRSDIIVAYMKNGNLMYVQQSDNYTVEYTLATGMTKPLLKIGMNEKLRFQFRTVD